MNETMCTCFHFRDQHCHACAIDHCLVGGCDCGTFAQMDVRSHINFVGRTI